MNILQTINGEPLITVAKADYAVIKEATGQTVRFGDVPIHNRPDTVYFYLATDIAPRATWKQTSSNGTQHYVGPTVVPEKIIPKLTNARKIVDLGSGGSDAATAMTKLPQRPHVMAVDAAIDTVITITPPRDVRGLQLCRADWENLPLTFPQADLIFAISSAGVYGNPVAVAKSIDSIANPGCVVLGTETTLSRFERPLSIELATQHGWQSYQSTDGRNHFFAAVKR